VSKTSVDYGIWDGLNDDGRSVAEVVVGHLMTPEARLEQWRPHLGWLPGNEGETVLDVGCGNGNYRRIFADLKRMVYTGLDYSVEMVRLAREANPGYEFLQGDATALPCGDGAYDLVFCTDMLMHLSDEQESAVISELRRVSRLYAVIHQRCLLAPPTICKQEKWGATYRYRPLDEVRADALRLDPTVAFHVGGVWPAGGINEREALDVYFIFLKGREGSHGD